MQRVVKEDPGSLADTPKVIFIMVFVVEIVKVKHVMRCSDGSAYFEKLREKHITSTTAGTISAASVHTDGFLPIRS